MEVKRTYYLIEVQSGVKSFARGPFQTEEEQDHAARIIREMQEEDDGLFWADVDEEGRLSIGPYIARFFLE